MKKIKVIISLFVALCMLFCFAATPVKTAPKVGEHILFGKFKWEDPDTATPLSWTVYRVDEKTGHCLLVTDRPLDKHYIHNTTSGTPGSTMATNIPCSDIIRELNGVEPLGTLTSGDPAHPSDYHDCKLWDFKNNFDTSEQKLIADHGWLENSGGYPNTNTGADKWTPAEEAAYISYYGQASGRTVNSDSAKYIKGWSALHNNKLAHYITDESGNETDKPYLISILSLDDQDAFNKIMYPNLSVGYPVTGANSTDANKWIKDVSAETDFRPFMINYMCKGFGQWSSADTTVERACVVFYRTPGGTTGYCAFVNGGGTRLAGGYDVASTIDGVRVALWYDYAKARGIKINK